MASGAPAAHPQQPPRPNFSRSHREPAREKHHLAEGGMAIPQSTRSTRFLDQRALLTDVKQSQLKQSQLQFQRSQNQHAMPQLQQSQGGPLKGNDGYQNYQKTVPVYAQSQGGGHARGPGIGQQQQQKGPQSYQGGIQQPGGQGLGEDAFQAGMQQPLGGEGGEEGILSFFDQLVEEQRDEITDAFNVFDANHDTYLDWHEFKIALKALGFDTDRKQITSWMKSHGVPPPNWPPPSNPAHPDHHLHYKFYPLPPNQNQNQNQPGPSNPKNKQNNRQTSRNAPPQRPPIPCPIPKLLMPAHAFAEIAAELTLSRDPYEELKKAFDLFDQGGKGIITVEDMRRVSQILGDSLEEEEMVGMIEEFDLDGKGGVNFDEFEACVGFS